MNRMETPQVDRGVRKSSKAEEEQEQEGMKEHAFKGLQVV